MRNATERDVKLLRMPPDDSHKGQNGRLLVIGGSHLFHAASLWALTVASRIVDLVHYSSVPENNALIERAKEEFRNGIVVPRGEVEQYILEDDVILIGPGMTRDDETKTLTHTLLTKFPDKQWVLDAGALQMLDLHTIPYNAVLTPHKGEFDGLWGKFVATGKSGDSHESVAERVRRFAEYHRCIVLLKGVVDIACRGIDQKSDYSASGECTEIKGGNAGMTKGGTGDVLAGLVAALACTNDPFLATVAGSFINKQAGDDLYEKVGPFFNSTDLVNQIPDTMKKLLLSE